LPPEDFPFPPAIVDDARGLCGGYGLGKMRVKNVEVLVRILITRHEVVELQWVGFLNEFVGVRATLVVL
jgi:hypothetical protein